MDENGCVEILDSALNRAHLYYRKAEAHLRYRRFDEAVVSHKNAAEKLEEAIAQTSFPRARESLQLQRDFHLRQQDIVKLKKQQFEMFKKTENQLRPCIVKRKSGHHTTEPSSDLQTRIYRKMDEADSLLEILCRREGESDIDELENEGNKPEIIEHVPEGEFVGSKHPKGEHVVIEELRTLNHQLRSLVVQLIDELEVKEKETASLREHVRVLQLEKEQRQHVEVTPPRKHSLHVITDSIGNSSPFVLSPCGDLSPDVLENRVIEDLPALAPLEMPSFDYSVFTQTNKKSASSTDK